jgi:hypothetical protein
MGAVKSEILQDVLLNYSVLPEMYGSIDDDFEYIPEQIEIEEVWFELKNLKTGKIRRINITDTLNHDQIIKFEDDVLAARAAVKQKFLTKNAKDLL